MADDDTTTQHRHHRPPHRPTSITTSLIQQIMQGGGGITGPAAPATPAVNTNLPVASLLGEALGGGVSPLYPMSEAQQTQAGNAALLNFGINMLQNSSGPVRHSLGQAIASGLLGAQGSLAGVREGQAQTLDVQNKQQQMGLEKIKTLLPLLQLQNQMRISGQPNPLDSSAKAPGGGLGATGAPIAPADGSGLNAAGDSATRKAAEGGPPAPNTPGAAVAQRTHDFWISQGYTEPQVAGILAGGPGSESDFTPTVSGDKGTSYGLYQHHGERLANMQKYFGLPAGQMPNEQQQNQYAAYEISPQGPLAGVGAQLRTAKTPAEAATVWTGGFGVPADKSEIARRANGANRFLGIYGPQPPQGGPTTATAPPVARPTAAPAAPAGTIQGTPDTGGTQVGGPGALPGKIAPPGPLVPGDVKAMIGGMTGAGASPTTLAPGGGTAAPIAPSASTVVANNAPVVQQSTQAQQPDTRADVELKPEEYVQRHFIPPTDADRQTFTVGVNPAAAQAQQVIVQNAQRQLAAAAQDRQNAVTPEARAAANKNYGEANQTLATATAALNELQGKADTATAAAAAKFAEDQRQRLTTTYNQLQGQKAAADLETQRGQQTIDLEKLKGQQAIQQAGVTSDIQAGQKILDTVNGTREGAQDTVNNLEIAKNFSKLAGTSGFLQQWPQVRNMLVRNNLLSSDEVQQMTAQQGLDAVMNKVILSMRAGSGMSRMTNFDLQFLQNAAPSSFTPEQMRPAMFAAIQSAAARQVQYVDRVNELHASGMPAWQARQQADTDLGHIVKETPTAYPQGDPRAGQPMSVDDQNKWIIRNVTPGTFYTQPNGALAIRGEPKQAQQ